MVLVPRISELDRPRHSANAWRSGVFATSSTRLLMLVAVA
jgi:hypothetical protein